MAKTCFIPVCEPDGSSMKARYMNAAGTVHLIYGSDNNYIFPTMISAASAAFGVRESYGLVVHLFDLGITDANYADFEERVQKVNPRTLCVRHVLDETLFDGFGAWRGSIATYSRMLVPDLLPDLDWAIYVDGDTLWLGDIGELWDLRDDTVAIQASVDPPTPMGGARPDVAWYREQCLEVDDSTYFCAGLILMNLRLMREIRMTQQCRDFMKRHPQPRVVDQTVLNFVLHGRSQLLPLEWGVFSVWHGTADLTRSACIHYVNDVPWRRDKLNRLLSDVVLLWYGFCEMVLGLDLLPSYLTSRWSRAWRRAVFVVLKANPWVLCLHPYIRSRFRNTHGLPKDVLRTIRNRWGVHRS
jgi:lipopolysaccharide biosynthesis glycosyltransferase